MVYGFIQNHLVQLYHVRHQQSALLSELITPFIRANFNMAVFFFLLSGLSSAASMQFSVKYAVAPSCDGIPIIPTPSGIPPNGDPAKPCGDGIKFYVVIAPCPVGADSGCWDEAPDACPGRLYHMPVGGCLPALPAGAGTYTTAALSVPLDPSRHLAASVYYSTPLGNNTFWHMEQDLATHVPLASAPSPVALAPYFNPFAAGSMHQIPKLDVPQFDAHMAAAVYLPPSCTENRAACPAAKMMVVTDGDYAEQQPATVSLLPTLLSRADALVMERRTRPLALLFVASVLVFSNGTTWACSRGAMYTIGPCPHECPQSLLCAGTYGQADTFFKFIQETALPLASNQFYGIGTGQKAGIVGFSYGGLVSCYAAWARPDVFDAAGCGSPSMWYPRAASLCTGLNGTDFYNIAMAKFPAPVANAARLFVSDGTDEACSMGGSASQPGSIPLTVQAMRSAGMGALVFEQNEGYQHDELSGWYISTLWRALSSIAPYVHRTPLET